MQKKAMIILAAIAMFGLIAGAAWAGPWGGSGYYNSYGTNNQAFAEETADLRSELAGKRGEYQALMSRDNPDPERAAQLQKEMVQLREQIRTKAQAYADTSEYGRYNGRGYADGWGHHRGGRGHYRGGGCW